MRENKTFLRRNAALILSFLIPFGIMLGIFIINGVYPFGDESFMHSDMYHQYVPFLSEMMRKVRNGESLLYSWNVGAGSNFTALFAYYMASPFNWLALLLPEQYLIEFMSYMVIAKIGLAGFTFCWYLDRHFNGAEKVPLAGNDPADGAIFSAGPLPSRLIFVPFAVFYAMSGYVAAYNWNVMWIDCIVIFPLIALGLEKLVSEGKYRLYCLSLAFCIFTNYYLSIMVCIFLMLYFIVLLVCQSGRRCAAPGAELVTGESRPASTGRWLAGCCIRFAVFSALAGGMAAVLLLPVYSALQLTEFTQFNFPDSWNTYFSVFDMLGRHCINVSVETGLDHWPNIYCGVAVILLVPLYLVNSRIPLREKAAKFALLAFLLVSFSTNVPNFIWHGFNYPNSLPCRQSFLYVFLLLTVVCEAVLRIRHCSLRTIGTGFCLSLGVVLLFEQLVRDVDAYPVESFLLTAILLCAYALFLYLYRTSRTRIPPRFLTAMLLIVVITEAAVNMYNTSCSVTSRSSYLENQDSYNALLDRLEAQDPDFYRIEKTDRKTKNDGTFTGYPTATLFSSTSNGNLVSFYEKMGMQNSKVYYCYSGATPLSSAFLSVRYLFSESPDEDQFLYILIGQDGDIYLYECNYTLPAGFLISDSTDRLERAIRSEYSNPIERQNCMVSALGIDAPLFVGTGSGSDGKSTVLSVETPGHYYAWVGNDAIDTLKLNSDFNAKTFSKLKNEYICDLGWFNTGDTVYLSSEDANSLDLSIYRLDPNVLQQTIDVLNAQTLTVTSHSANHISGQIEVTEAGDLILSVPYEPGWSITVDGKKVEADQFADTFLQVSLGVGTHSIELSYCPEGLGAGAVLSLICAAAFVMILLLDRKYGQKVTTAVCVSTCSATCDNACNCTCTDACSSSCDSVTEHQPEAAPDISLPSERRTQQ